MMSRLRSLLFRDDKVCPWWFIGSFDNPLRHYVHKPEQILGDLVAPGQTVIDLGCGMGYFTIPLAHLVGESGQVIAVDLQRQMLCGVQRRAVQAGLQGRIQLHQCQTDTLDLYEAVDFALAFWMAHEVRDKERFFHEVVSLLKPTARFLLVEPKWHVSRVAFRHTVALACTAGLEQVVTPRIGLSQAVLFVPRKEPTR
ncbi:MAG: class I SAM-dependent methyltransferase [Caldilinea sp. CFX5]|nr:class I SAM-dependent methyltransferase [Caldilinea sp. CFX5]